MRYGHWYRRALWGASAAITSSFYPWAGVGVLALLSLVAFVMPDR
jgi:hypothetical protein